MGSTGDITVSTGWQQTMESQTKHGKRSGESLSLVERYKQQLGTPYRPDLSPANLWPYYGIGAVIFIVMGIAIVALQAQLIEIRVPYTHCRLQRQCEISFSVEQEMKGPILIYYHLINFHQNHRSYVDSRDDGQLAGGSILGRKCPQYNNTNKPTLPCGAVANTVFNDTIIKITRKKHYQEVPLSKENITFPREKHAYTINTDETDLWNKVKKPESWSEEKWNDFKTKDIGYEEDLKVWMRTSALQNFRKLWRRVNHSKGEVFNAGLPENSNYTIIIENNFAHAAGKSVIIAQQSFFGAKSYKQGVICLCVGVFLALSACVLRNLAKLEESVAM